MPGLKTGGLVVAPFLWADNTCDFRAKGLHTSCRHGGRYGFDGVDGGSMRAVRQRRRHGWPITARRSAQLDDIHPRSIRVTERPG